jgi:FkbM family methyltransferase
MKHFLDLGAHKLEGLQEFTKKLGIDKKWKVYSYEPNILIQEEAKKVVQDIKDNYKSLEFYDTAIMDESGVITFNCHRGAWKDQERSEYWDGYTTGSNALDTNPEIDIGNGVIFDRVQYDVECVDIEDILSEICNKDPEAEIYIKCDIEGSEFVVLPRIIESEYVHHIKEMYIEWHERMWYHEGQEGIISKQKERAVYTANLNKLGIKCFVHH